MARWLKDLAKAVGAAALDVFPGNMFKVVDAAGAYLYFLVGKGGSPSLRDEVAAVRTFLPSRVPAVVIDGGANTGEWAALLHAMTGGRCRIFACEPNPNLVEKLRERKEIFEVWSVALGERPGDGVLWLSHSSDTTASLVPRSDTLAANRQYTAIPVRIARLDDLIEEYNIAKVDFLKLDVEGWELAALKGAKKALEGGRIGALSVEFGLSNVNTKVFFRDIWTFMSTVSRFRAYRLSAKGKLLRIVQYDEALEYFRGVSTYIFDLRNGNENKDHDNADEG